MLCFYAAGADAERAGKDRSVIAHCYQEMRRSIAGDTVIVYTTADTAQTKSYLREVHL